MELQKESLERIIKMLTHAASDDTTRYALNNLQITVENPTSPEPKHVRLSACDGHMLSEVILLDECLAKAAPCYIHRDQIDFLKVVLKSSDKFLSVVLNVESSPGSLKIDGKEICSKDVKFPNIAQLRPTWTPEFEIGLDVELLLDLCKSMNGNKKQLVKLGFGKDKLTPIKVSASGHSGVLMPCRI